MSSVALIGGDGAGKTTIALDLTRSERFRAKYLYMGMSAQSGDRLLPTSRLVLAMRRRAYRRRAAAEGSSTEAGTRIPASEYEYSSRERGRLWVSARLLNRFLEAWYRQLVSVAYQARGYLVVYDRHFLLDGGILDPDGPRPPGWAEQLYRWAGRHLFPRPDLVIFLDTPGDVLYARKGEASAEYLDDQARMYLAQAMSVKRFIRVDASRPLEEVIEAVTQAVSLEILD